MADQCPMWTLHEDHTERRVMLFSFFSFFFPLFVCLAFSFSFDFFFNI